MMTIRYRVRCSSYLGSAGEPWVVIRVEFDRNGVPRDITVAAGPFEDISDAYRAMSSLVRMES